MAASYQLTIIGEPAPATPSIIVDGRALLDGQRAEVDLAQAVALVERGLALPRGKIEIEAILKLKRGMAVMVDGKPRYDGDVVAAGWVTAQLLVARDRARLADGVRLPLNDPDARK